MPSNRSTTVIVTGVAGFIGSNTAERLLQERPAVTVIGIDNLDPYYPVAYKKRNLAILAAYPNFTFYKADIRNAARMKEIFDTHRPDGVLHIAAKADTRDAVQNPEPYLSVNITGTLNLLECAKEHAVKRFVFISSGSVYGNANKPPYDEAGDTDHALSPYGMSKKAGEMLVYTYAHNFALSAVCLRIFNAYGRRMRPGLVLYRWTEALLAGKPIEVSGSGKRIRNYTYIDDLVEAILLALKKPGIDYAVLNIGATERTSLNDLIRVVEQATDVQAKRVSRPSAKASTEASFVSVTKAKRVLGWKPTTSLADGVSAFVAWYRDERVKESKKRR